MHRWQRVATGLRNRNEMQGDIRSRINKWVPNDKIDKIERKAPNCFGVRTTFSCADLTRPCRDAFYLEIVSMRLFIRLISII